MKYLITLLLPLLLMPLLSLNIRVFADEKNSCREILSESDFASFTDGFCSDDTFRIKITASPEKEKTAPGRMKETSRKKAILAAQYRLIEGFYGACISGGCGENVPEDFLKKKKAYKDKVVRIIKEGTVKYTQWDSNGNCTIIFEITRPGLKEFLKNCY